MMPYNIYDFEVIIDPLIFEISIELSRLAYDEKNRKVDIEYEVSKFDAYTLSLLNDFNGDIYTNDRFRMTFGLPISDREHAIKIARQFHQLMKDKYPDDYRVDMGFSTLGLKEHEHIHKNINSYKGKPDFQMVMSGYIRYLSIDEFENWTRGETS